MTHTPSRAKAPAGYEHTRNDDAMTHDLIGGEGAPTGADWPIIRGHTFMAKLVVIEGSARGTVYVLDQSEMSIGRSSANDIAIADLSLSRRHSAIRFANGSYTVRDLESNNGTFVNDLPI